MGTLCFLELFIELKYRVLSVPRLPRLMLSSCHGVPFHPQTCPGADGKFHDQPGHLDHTGHAWLPPCPPRPSRSEGSVSPMPRWESCLPRGPDPCRRPSHQALRRPCFPGRFGNSPSPLSPALASRFNLFAGLTFKTETKKKIAGGQRI